MKNVKGMDMTKRRQNQGFTILELIVIIAVIAILVTIAIVGVTRFLAQARDGERQVNTDVVATYLEKYYDDKGEYPACAAITDTPGDVSSNILVGISEEVLVMPGSASETANSIVCTDITEASNDNILGYVGVNCNLTACGSWALKYKSELTGEVVVVTSNRTAGIVGASGDWTDIAATDGYSCATTDTNQIYCWGTGPTTPQLLASGAIPGGATLSDLTAGSGHFCVIANDWLYCWGNNTNGRLGDGTTTARLTPTAIVNGTIPGGSDITDVAAGGNHTCALASDGVVYCWGYGANGQLGRGNTTSSTSPVSIVAGAIPGGTTVSRVVSGGTNSCVLMSNSWVYCWGTGSNGELGNGSTSQSNSPVALSRGAIPLAATISDVDTGGSHSCVITNSQLAYCWGAGFNGRLGNGGIASSSLPVAVTQGALLFTNVSVSFGTSCAQATNLTTQCWGYNGNGQLGLGYTVATVTTPQPVLAGAVPGGVALTDVSSSSLHACSLGTNQVAYCWGDGSGGELGNGGTANTTQPVQVTAP